MPDEEFVAFFPALYFYATYEFQGESAVLRVQQCDPYSVERDQAFYYIRDRLENLRPGRRLAMIALISASPSI